MFPQNAREQFLNPFHDDEQHSLIVRVYEMHVLSYGRTRFLSLVILFDLQVSLSQMMGFILVRD